MLKSGIARSPEWIFYIKEKKAGRFKAKMTAHLINRDGNDYP
jgi:hypothetical protein